MFGPYSLEIGKISPWVLLKWKIYFVDLMILECCKLGPWINFGKVAILVLENQQSCNFGPCELNNKRTLNITT